MSNSAQFSREMADILNSEYFLPDDFEIMMQRMEERDRLQDIARGVWAFEELPRWAQALVHKAKRERNYKKKAFQDSEETQMPQRKPLLSKPPLQSESSHEADIEPTEFVEERPDSYEQEDTLQETLGNLAQTEGYESHQEDQGDSGLEEQEEGEQERAWEDVSLDEPIPLEFPEEENPITVTKLRTPEQYKTVEQWISSPLSLEEMTSRIEVVVGHHLSDAFLGEAAEENGFAGLPHVVTSQQLDRYIKAGELELFRGVRLPEQASATKKGKLWCGTGAYGSGTYTAYPVKDPSVSHLFFDDPANIARGYGPVIMRMSIKNGANIWKYDDVNNLREDTIEDIVEKMRKSGPLEKSRLEKLLCIFRDAGRFALLMGIDGYDCRFHGGASNGSPFIVILNRTALRIQEEDFQWHLQ